MSEPIGYHFTEEALIRAARDFMKETGHDIKEENPDWYYTRLGLLMDFVTDLIKKARGD